DHRGALAVLERLRSNAPHMPGDTRQLIAAVEQRRRAIFDALMTRARERVQANDHDGALEALNLIPDHDGDEPRALALADKVGTARIARARGAASSSRPKPSTAESAWDLSSLLDPRDPRRRSSR